MSSDDDLFYNAPAPLSEGSKATAYVRTRRGRHFCHCNGTQRLPKGFSCKTRCCVWNLNAGWPNFSGLCTLIQSKDEIRQYCGKFSSPNRLRVQRKVLVEIGQIERESGSNGNRDGIAQKKLASSDQMSFSRSRSIPAASILEAEGPGSGIKFVGCGSCRK